MPRYTAATGNAYGVPYKVCACFCAATSLNIAPAPLRACVRYVPDLHPEVTLTKEYAPSRPPWGSAQSVKKQKRPDCVGAGKGGVKSRRKMNVVAQFAYYRGEPLQGYTPANPHGTPFAFSFATPFLSAQNGHFAQFGISKV